MNTKSTPLLLAIVLLASCATGSGGPQTTITGGEGQHEMTQLGSGQVLSRDLEIVDLIQVRKDGFLVAQFDLHNKRGSARTITWTIDWFDADGLKVDRDDAWRSLFIGGKGFETIKATAPTQSATSWRLQLQKPNPVR